jgi:hypothetical protein
LVAHDLVNRPSRDIDFATATALPLPPVADRLACAYRAAGYAAEVIEATFAAYGLADADVSALAQWARAWESNVRERLASGESGPTGPSETEWDSYLDRD